MMLRPLRHTRTQAAQSVLQFSLLVVVMINLAWAQFVQDSQGGTIFVSGTAVRTREVLDAVSLLFVYVLPGIALTVPLTWTFVLHLRQVALSSPPSA